MQAQLILRLCGVPEYLNLSGLDLGSAYNPGPASDSSWQSNIEPKQRRQGKHTRREWGQIQCGQDTASTHQCYLFAVFLPPHSTTELLLLLSHFSRVQLCVTPWTAASQAPLSMGFSRQEYWSGVVPLPSPIIKLYS